jgi:hypothetical protein
MADATDSKSVVSNDVGVQVPSPAPKRRDKRLFFVPKGLERSVKKQSRGLFLGAGVKARRSRAAQVPSPAPKRRDKRLFFVPKGLERSVKKQSRGLFLGAGVKARRSRAAQVPSPKRKRGLNAAIKPLFYLSVCFKNCSYRGATQAFRRLRLRPILPYLRAKARNRTHRGFRLCVRA